MRKYDAIRTVLEDAGRPLHYTAIADAIRDQGLYQSTSLNWYKAVNSDLSKIVRTRGADGREPWLYRYSRGVYGLSVRKKMEKHKAIRTVLEDAGRPLKVEEIADAIQKRDLYRTKSKNWVNAVGSDLSKIIRVMEAEGKVPWLYRESLGVYGLSEWKKV